MKRKRVDSIHRQVALVPFLLLLLLSLVEHLNFDYPRAVDSRGLVGMSAALVSAIYLVIHKVSLPPPCLQLVCVPTGKQKQGGNRRL